MEVMRPGEANPGLTRTGCGALPVSRLNFDAARGLLDLALYKKSITRDDSRDNQD